MTPLNNHHEQLRIATRDISISFPLYASPKLLHDEYVIAVSHEDAALFRRHLTGEQLHLPVFPSAEQTQDYRCFVGVITLQRNRRGTVPMLYRYLRSQLITLHHGIPTYTEWTSSHLRIFIFIGGGLPTHDLLAILDDWLTRAGLTNSPNVQVHPRASTTLALPYRNAASCPRWLTSRFSGSDHPRCPGTVPFHSFHGNQLAASTDSSTMENRAFVRIINPTTSAPAAADAIPHGTAFACSHLRSSG